MLKGVGAQFFHRFKRLNGSTKFEQLVEKRVPCQPIVWKQESLSVDESLSRSLRKASTAYTAAQVPTKTNTAPRMKPLPEVLGS